MLLLVMKNSSLWLTEQGKFAANNIVESILGTQTVIQYGTTNR